MNQLLTQNILQGVEEKLVSEIKEKAGRSLSVTAQALDQMTTTLNQSVNKLSDVKAEAKESLVQSASSATNTITEATIRAVHSLTETTNSVSQAAEKTKFSLNETLQKSEKLGGILTDSVQDYITTSAQSWFVAHPFIAWILTHPLWTVGIIFLTLFLSWGLIRVIAQLSEQMWLFILQSPFKRFQKKPDSISQDPKQQLLETLIRLEALRQEQDELLRKVKEILASEQ